MMQSMRPPKAESEMVFVIDDDPSVRIALEDLLSSIGMAVQTFGSVQEFLHGQLPDCAGCLVLDIRMPGLSGLEFQRDMADLGVHLPIIFITGHGDIPMSVQAMKAGAIEFLTKPFREQDLLDAIRVGIEKDRIRRLEAIAAAELSGRFSALTPGERQVMALVVSGRLNKQIAAELGVSEITVKVRRGHVMQKMQAKSVPDLVRMADRLGLGEDGSVATTAPRIPKYS